MNLKATTNVRQYINAVTKEEKKRVQRATVIANQRAAKEALTEGKNEIKSNYTIKATELNKQTKVLNGNYNNPAAKIKGFGKGISLRVFKYRPTKVPNQKGIPVSKRKPVMVEVKKGEVKELKGAFLHKFGKQVGIFKRLTTASNSFVKLLGPGIAQLLGVKNIFTKIKLKAKKEYAKHYEQAYKYAKSK